MKDRLISLNCENCKSELAGYDNSKLFFCKNCQTVLAEKIILVPFYINEKKEFIDSYLLWKYPEQILF